MREMNVCEECGREVQFDTCRWSDCPKNFSDLPCGKRWERGFCGRVDVDPCRDCDGCDPEEEHDDEHDDVVEDNRPPICLAGKKVKVKVI